MSIYNSTITFGSVTLFVDRLMTRKLPGTLKQVIGKTLRQRTIPGRAVQDWRITITGRHVDTSRDADRATLQGYQDLKIHTLTDGYHDGNYFIESIRYEDAGNTPTSYKFTLVLIQDQ